MIVHVQELANQAVQELRIKYRWQALDDENDSIKQAKQNRCSYQAALFSNGDSRKQLLARARHLLHENIEKMDIQSKREGYHSF